MNIEKTGGPAFPVKGFVADASGALCGEVVNNSGMSLLDYFAGQMMLYLCQHYTKEKAAELSYKYSAEMIKEREKYQ